MNISEDFLNIAELIGEALQIDPIIEKSAYLFQIDGMPDPIALHQDDVSQVINRLKQMEIVEDTALFDGMYYEVLIREETSRRIPFSIRVRGEGLKFIDQDNQISYYLSPPTDEYIVFLLRKLAAIAPLPLAFRLPPATQLNRILGQHEGSTPTAFDVIRRLNVRLLTLRIESGHEKSLQEIIRHANAFIFQISYNLDIAFVPERYFEDLVRTGRIRGHRRGRFDDLDPPRRTYIPDLIYHYQLAVASDSPPLEYLSYYHIAEHFFESVFEEDIIRRVRTIITQPDFSYRRKRDIKKLISEVKKSLRFRAEGTLFSEEEALRLTLAKYLSITQLAQRLDVYDPKLIDHYRENEVPFSRGNKVDLSAHDTEQVFSLLAKRIYNTRNAIVHSKEGEKGKYIPFEDDRELVSEVPLLRFIAELIIIHSSNLIS